MSDHIDDMLEQEAARGSGSYLDPEQDWEPPTDGAECEECGDWVSKKQLHCGMCEDCIGQAI